MPKYLKYSYSLLLYFLFLTNTTVSVFAQSHIVDSRKLSVEEGLSGMYVIGVQEDQKGFIWVATWLGLNRFDGFEFKEYSSKDYGFKYDKPSEITIDPNGNLWLINLIGNRYLEAENTHQHIDIFNPTTETLENEHFYSQLTFKTSSILSIRNDLDKNIWIGLLNGEIYKYDGNQLKLIIKADPFIQFEITSDQTIATLLPDEKNIQFYNLQGEIINQFPIDSKVNNLFPDNNGGIILLPHITDESHSQQNFLHLHPKSSLKPIHFLADGKKLEFQKSFSSNKLNIDANGNIWMFNNKSVFLFDKNYNLIYDFKKELNSKRLASTSLYFDNKNKTWLSTAYGVYILNLRKNQFSNHLIPSLDFAETRGITQDTFGNIYINQIRTYQLPYNKKTVNSIKINGNRAAYFSKDNKLLLGSNTPFIWEYDPLLKEKKSYPFYDAEDPKLFFGVTNTIYQSSKTGRIYLGTSKKGISILDRKEEKILPFTNFNEFEDIQNLEIYCFTENKDGIWIGTSSGFYLLDENQGIVQHFELNEKNETPISILHIYEDANQDFWIGTFQHGLYKWSASEGILLHLTTENGLSDNTIYAIYEDEFEQFWMSSNIGLMQIDKNDLTIKNYLPSDGIPHEEFNRTSHFQDKNGKLYFGGMRGVTTFHPKDFNQRLTSNNTSTPKVSQIESFNQKSEKWNDYTSEFRKNEKITLAKANTNLKIKLAAIDLINIDRNQFSYRFDNSSPWINMKNNLLEIQKIESGNSILQIRTRTRNNEWSTTPLEINIFRAYPFYFRFPFLFGIFLAIVSLIYFYIQWANNEKRKQEAKIKEAIVTIKASLTPTPNAVVQPSQTKPSEIKIEEEKTVRIFVDEWQKTLNKNANLLIDDGKFSIKELAATMNLSERQFRRKLKQKTNLRPVEYMREIRLQKAELLLINKTYSTVSEVCFAVGFSTPKHFSKIFKEKFGKSPSTYLVNKLPS